FRSLQAELHSGGKYQLSSVHNDVFEFRKGQDTAADVKIGASAQIQADLSIADRESTAAYLDAGIIQTAQAVNAQTVLVHKVIIDIAIELEPIDLDPGLILGQIKYKGRCNGQFVGNRKFRVYPDPKVFDFRTIGQ